MKIYWIIRAPLTEREQQLSSDLAGVRMRSIMPITELRRLGHEASIMQLPFGTNVTKFTISKTSDVAVFGPVVPAQNESIDDAGILVFGLAESLRKLGIMTVADIHDDHFDVPGRSRYFQTLVRVADAVIANTDAMAQVVRRHCERPVFVVGDPYEGPRGEPRFAPVVGRTWLDRMLAPRGARLKLAWFGHQYNLQSVYDLARALAALGKRWPIHLTLVCRDGFGAREFCENFNHYHGRRCRMEFIAWSLMDTRQALQECDLVVIPSDATRSDKMLKSANRVIESLRAGRYPIVNPVPSYQEFSEYAWLGDDIAQGIEWAVKNAHEVRERTRLGQTYVEQHYSPAALGKQWERVLREIVGKIPSAGH